MLQHTDPLVLALLTTLAAMAASYFLGRRSWLRAQQIAAARSNFDSRDWRSWRALSYGLVVFGTVSLFGAGGIAYALVIQ